MVDALRAPMAPKPVLRADYAVPDWLIPDVALDFELDPARSMVRARLNVERNGAHDSAIRLDGDGLVPVRVTVDGIDLGDNGWSLDDGHLVIPLSGDAHVIETEVALRPDRNTPVDGAVRVRRQPVHPVRGAGISSHYLLPRPARRAVALFRAHGGG